MAGTFHKRARLSATQKGIRGAKAGKRDRQSHQWPKEPTNKKPTGRALLSVKDAEHIRASMESSGVDVERDDLEIQDLPATTRRGQPDVYNWFFQGKAWHFMNVIRNWGMDLYLEYLQVMAIVQLCWGHHTVCKGWISVGVWVKSLVPLLGGPTRDSVWSPILLEKTLELRKLTTEEYAQHIVDYANNDISVIHLMRRLRRDGVHPSILELLKDIAFDCLSLALRFNPAPFFPLLGWRNAPMSPAVRSQTYLLAQAATWATLAGLAQTLRSRPEAESIDLLCAFYGDWQLRRIPSVILATDFAWTTGFTSLGALTKSELATILVEKWAGLGVVTTAGLFSEAERVKLASAAIKSASHSALSSCHDLGVLHDDLHAANVLMQWHQGDRRFSLEVIRATPTTPKYTSDGAATPERPLEHAS